VLAEEEAAAEEHSIFLLPAKTCACFLIWQVGLQGQSPQEDHATQTVQTNIRRSKKAMEQVEYLLSKFWLLLGPSYSFLHLFCTQEETWSTEAVIKNINPSPGFSLFLKLAWLAEVLGTGFTWKW